MEAQAETPRNRSNGGTRRVLLIVAALILVGVACAWLGAGLLVERARRFTEAALSAALKMPAEIVGLEVDLFPAVVRVAGLKLGVDGATLSIERADLHLHLRQSLRRMRPVADLEASGVWVDPFALPDEPDGDDDQEAPLPFAFELRRVTVANGRVRVLPAPRPLDVAVDRALGRLEGEPLRTWLQVSARARGLVVERGSERQRLERLDGALAFGPDGFSLRYLRADGDALRLRGQRTSRQPLRHSVRAEIDLTALRLVDPNFSAPQGSVTLDGHLIGALDAPRLEAQVHAAEVSYDRERVADLRAEVAIDDGGVDLQKAALGFHGGRIEADGRLRFDEGLPFRVKATWNAIAASTPNAEATEAARTMQTSGRTTLDGTLDPLRVTGDASGTLARAHPTQVVPLEWQVDGAYDDGSGQATLRATQGGGNRLNGTLRVSEDGTLAGELVADIGDALAVQPLLSAGAVQPVRGTLHAEARIAGSLQQPRLAGELHGQDVAAFGVGIVRLDGRFAADRERVVADGVRMVVGDGAAAVSGTFGIGAGVGNNWRAELHSLPVNDLVTAVHALTGTALPLWGGRVDAAASGEGPWSQVTLRGTAALTDTYVAREPLQHVGLNVDARWPEWTAQLDVRHRAEEGLAASARGTGFDRIALRVDSDEWRVDELRGASRRALAGRLRLHLAADGPPRALAGQFELEGRDLRWGPRRLDHLVLVGHGRAGDWSIDGDLSGLIDVGGRVGSAPGWPFALSLKWQDAELAPFVTEDADTHIVSSGGLEASGELADLARLRGTLLAPRLEIQRGSYQLAATRPVDVRVAAGRLTIASLSMAGPGTQLDASGWLTLGGTARVRLLAHGDLQLIEIVDIGIEAARGGVSVDAELSREAGRRWVLAGQGTLTDAALDFGREVSLSDVKGRAVLAGSAVRIEELGGRFAGGTFTLGGDVDVADGPSLTWKVMDASPALVRDVELELSGQGTVGGTWEDLMVAGEIQVERALYDKDIALTDFIPQFRRVMAVPPSTEPPRRRIHLDLRVTAPDEIFIDNNVAKAEARATLEVTGTTADIVLAGPIEVLTGEVTFRERTFQLTSGVIDFRPPLGLVPYLNLNAENTVSTSEASYTVRVQVVGPMDDYRVLLTSDDPGLSQTDVASLATFGKTAAELQQGGGGVSVNDLIALTPGLVTSHAEKGVTRFLRVDRVEIEPGYTKTTGAYEPRVSLGKDFTEDLTAFVSTTFGVEASRRVQLEYRLTPRVSLLGSWESETEAEAGAFGGLLRFRYQFRRLPRFSLLAPWRGWRGGELR